MRCDQCKHWDNEPGKFRRAAEGIGRCTRAHAFWDRSEWMFDDKEYDRVLKPEAANDMMFVQDGSDYVALLFTKAEFFCAHFEQKESK